jgi:hypothetical protein
VRRVEQAFSHDGQDLLFVHVLSPARVLQVARHEGPHLSRLVAAQRVAQRRQVGLGYEGRARGRLLVLLCLTGYGGGPALAYDEALARTDRGVAHERKDADDCSLNLDTRKTRAFIACTSVHVNLVSVPHYVTLYRRYI